MFPCHMMKVMNSYWHSSNAGKSSALNSLTSNSKFTRTSKMPGRTQEINLFQVNEEIKLLDLPAMDFLSLVNKNKKTGINFCKNILNVEDRFAQS